ncbi:MAG: glycoside hydrolase family 3 C-terminal domain-containing protein [Ignavibacteriae bacterium]|nr:glycoside hydrolase family 3 C-terminal domain-containing protein [Ignavibacteriota bacterium]
MMFRALIAAALLVTLAPAHAGAQARPPYKDPARSVEERVNDLLGRMTIEEKFWQLFMIPGDLSDGKQRYKNGIFGLNIRDQQRKVADTEQMLEYHDSGVAANTAAKINEIQKFFLEETRLGIPIIAFDEALHGLVRNDATAFPQAIGLAATWDTTLVGKIGAAIAREARSRGIRDLLCPVINLARDARWGRVEETFGEDPFLMSEVTAAYVRNIEDLGVVVTPKHLIANVGDGGRDSYPIDFNERTLEEVYYPPFLAAVKRGRTTSFMTSYNSLDGLPCTANPALLKDKVKKEWGFDGFIISDASAVGGLLDLHHIVSTRQGSAKAAIEGGLDVIFQTAYEHHEPLLDAFKKGMVDTAAVNDAVRRVLRAKFRLGLFEHPYVETAGATFWSGHADHRSLALQSARESIVLLKNAGALLPLNGRYRSIAVIGSDAVEARLGGYSGAGIGVVSILDGIRKRAAGAANVLYAPGCGRLDTTYVTVPSTALTTPDGKPGLKAEYFNSIDLSGAPVLTRVDREVDFGWTLFSADPKVNFDWFSVRWTGTLTSPLSGAVRFGFEGDDGYRLYMNDSLVIDRWQKRGFATTTVPVHMTKGQKYRLRLEFHEGVGNVRVRMVWDAGVASKEQAIKDAIDAAGASDIAIVVAGVEEGEFRDRSSLALPGRQEELIRRIAATGKPVVVVIVGGSAVTMEHWLDRVGAVVDVWYPGEKGGTAVAEVLFGDYNPAGRLPITFPDVVGQAPLYYNHKPTGRGDDYMDHTGKPLFPFGYGLSYTNFSYSGLRITPEVMKADKRVVVNCTVKNTGSVTGDEVVQLYIRDVEASVARPVMELRGFRRITLKPGEWKDVRFELGFDELSMLDAHMKRIVEPGDIKIMIGASSADIRLRGFVKVTAK